MGILDAAELATSIYEGFTGELLTGTIRNFTPPTSGALDRRGDPVELSKDDVAIEGFVENYDEAYRARAGIPETDLMVNWFSQSAPSVLPKKDSLISMTQDGVTTWYQVRRVKTDPAHALWSCQSFIVKAPTS